MIPAITHAKICDNIVVLDISDTAKLKFSLRPDSSKQCKATMLYWWNWKLVSIFDSSTKPKNQINFVESSKSRKFDSLETIIDHISLLFHILTLTLRGAQKQTYHLFTIQIMMAFFYCSAEGNFSLSIYCHGSSIRFKSVSNSFDAMLMYLRAAACGILFISQWMSSSRQWNLEFLPFQKREKKKERRERESQHFSDVFFLRLGPKIFHVLLSLLVLSCILSSSQQQRAATIRMEDPSTSRQERSTFYLKSIHFPSSMCTWVFKMCIHSTMTLTRDSCRDIQCCYVCRHAKVNIFNWLHLLKKSENLEDQK